MLQLVPQALSKLHATHDEDSIDRINYVYTTTIMFGFSILLTAKSYIGKPIQCWVPAQFKGGWETYIENHCLIENTYFVRMDEHLPDLSGERQRRELAYYQWLPFILAIQGALCYAPRLVWKKLNDRSGISLRAFIPMALQTKKQGNKKVLNDNDYPLIVHRLGDQFALAQEKSLSRFYFGSYITLSYLFTKFLWLVIIFAQFVILNKFLGPQYTFWGIGILVDLINNRDWSTSGHFPRVTYCDVEVREMGNLHNWTVQCVLMVNMFAEKIFLFIWFWLSFVAIATLINLIYWLYVTLKHSESRSFIKKYLVFKREVIHSDDDVDDFLDHVLRKDGITILRLISDNCGDLAVAEIVDELWRTYESKDIPEMNGKKKLLSGDEDP